MEKCVLKATKKKNIVNQNYQIKAGAHHWEPATTPYSCHGVFTDLSIFSLNLPRIQTPAGTTVTNHKHGLDSLIDVGIFTGRLKGKAAIVSLTDARSCRTELTYFAGKEV